jgi:hypothetical protein
VAKLSRIQKKGINPMLITQCRIAFFLASSAWFKDSLNESIDISIQVTKGRQRSVPANSVSIYHSSVEVLWLRSNYSCILKAGWRAICNPNLRIFVEIKRRFAFNAGGK